MYIIHHHEYFLDRSPKYYSDYVDIQEVVCKLDLDHAATSPQVKEGVDGEESLRQSQARGRSSSSRLCLPAKVGSLLTH